MLSKPVPPLPTALDFANRIRATANQFDNVRKQLQARITQIAKDNGAAESANITKTLGNQFTMTKDQLTKIRVQGGLEAVNEALGADDVAALDAFLAADTAPVDVTPPSA